MPRSDRFILPIPDLQNRIEALMGRLGDDAGMRRQFLSEPVTTVLQGVSPEAIPALSATSLSRGNQLMRSALSNESFRAWAGHYQSGLRAAQAAVDAPAGRTSMDKEQVLRDISKALVDAGDPELVSDWSKYLLDSEQFDSVTVTDDIAVVTKAVAILLVVVTAIDATPYVPPELGDFVSTRDLRALADVLATEMRSVRSTE